jgi:hypothetical protein|tara:strand:+ start:8413 stop:8742 length:330 start_codon:yes stop_codon:yes gene_type:complete
MSNLSIKINSLEYTIEEAQEIYWELHELFGDHYVEPMEGDVTFDSDLSFGTFNEADDVEVPDVEVPEYPTTTVEPWGTLNVQSLNDYEKACETMFTSSIKINFGDDNGE